MLVYCFILLLLLQYNILNAFFKNNFRLPTKTTFVNKPSFTIIEPIKNKMNQLFTNKKTSGVIFLTGGANIMPPEIYSNFLNTLASYDHNVYLANFRNPNQFQSIFDYLNGKNSSNEIVKQSKIAIIGHSSSAKLCIDMSNKFNFIENIILLDPVDSRLSFNDLYLNIMNKPNKIKLTNAKKVIIINAGKSYKGSWKPLSIPFIPILSLNTSNLIFERKRKPIIKKFQFDDYGHTDLLDKPWGDLMHYNRISVGTNDRNYSDINNYHNSIVKIIDKFMKEGC